LASKIPKVVREKVITEWQQGQTRDNIAKNNDIGDGTVTEIIKTTEKTTQILTNKESSSLL
jgi:transposase